MLRRSLRSTLFPYTTLFRSEIDGSHEQLHCCSHGPTARPRCIVPKKPLTGRRLQRPDEQAVLTTRRDLLGDLDCQLQRGCRLRTGNPWLAPGACAFDERSELKLERFAVFDLHSVTPNLFSDAAIDLAALILIIEREIR